MSKESKTARINCRATPRIAEALFKIAELEERSASDMICRLVSEEARRRGLWPADAKETGVGDLYLVPEKVTLGTELCPIAEPGATRRFIPEGFTPPLYEED